MADFTCDEIPTEIKRTMTDQERRDRYPYEQILHEHRRKKLTEFEKNLKIEIATLMSEIERFRKQFPGVVYDTKITESKVGYSKESLKHISEMYINRGITCEKNTDGTFTITFGPRIPIERTEIENYVRQFKEEFPLEHYMRSRCSLHNGDWRYPPHVLEILAEIYDVASITIDPYDGWVGPIIKFGGPRPETNDGKGDEDG